MNSRTLTLDELEKSEDIQQIITQLNENPDSGVLERAMDIFVRTKDEQLSRLLVKILKEKDSGGSK